MGAKIRAIIDTKSISLPWLNTFFLNVMCRPPVLVGADTVFELQEYRLRRSCCPNNLFNDTSKLTVNEPTVKRAQAFTISNLIASFRGCLSPAAPQCPIEINSGPDQVHFHYYQFSFSIQFRFLDEQDFDVSRLGVLKQHVCRTDRVFEQYDFSLFLSKACCIFLIFAT